MLQVFRKSWSEESSLEEAINQPMMFYCFRKRQYFKILKKQRLGGGMSVNTNFFLDDQQGAERKTQNERQDGNMKGQKSRGGLNLFLIHIFID